MTPSTIPSTTFHRNNQWLSSWVGHEMIMMSGSCDFYLSLSETAGRIWDLLERPGTANSLCDTLEHEYGAEPAAIRDGVEFFLGQMLAEGMIQEGFAPSLETGPFGEGQFGTGYGPRG